MCTPQGQFVEEGEERKEPSANPVRKDEWEDVWKPKIDPTTQAMNDAATLFHRMPFIILYSHSLVNHLLRLLNHHRGRHFFSFLISRIVFVDIIIMIIPTNAFSQLVYILPAPTPNLFGVKQQPFCLLQWPSLPHPANSAPFPFSVDYKMLRHSAWESECQMAMSV